MVGYSLMRCERDDTYGWGLSGIILMDTPNSQPS